jgi:urea transporter
MSNENTVPLWKQILRGYSQCAFQANEVTGIIFIIAVALFNWQMAALFVATVVAGTLTARVLKGIPPLLDLGLYGFNSGLIGVAMGNFFIPEPMLWVWAVVFSIIAAVLTVVMSKCLPFPFLAAPFILTFWAVWLLAGTLGITPVDFGAFPEIPIDWGKSIIVASGSALFIPSLLCGCLFLVGIAVSNWRHALVALIGAFLANALAAQAGAAGGAVNFGFAGFNGVLAALAAYVIIAPDLRLVTLAAVLSTWFASYIFRGASVPVLAAGFVLSIWFILFLAWLNPRFAGNRSEIKNK